MINEVRNTVLSILAKDNRGYVTPLEFNLYAKQAQLDIFERYIYLYSNAIIKQNERMHGEGYSDVPKKLSEVLDTFYKVDSLTYTAPYFEAPADSYFIQKLVLNNKEIEKVSQQKVLYLLASNLTAPTAAYPVYTLMDNDGTTTSRSNFTVYPNTITANVDAHYLRYPKEPKWTYTSVSGDPLFNPSPSLGYQDFELPMSDFSDLVVKILQYAGVSIREQEVMAAAKAEELQEIQQKQ